MVWDVWEGGCVEEEGCEDCEGHTPSTINLLVSLLHYQTHSLLTSVRIMMYDSKLVKRGLN